MAAIPVMPRVQAKSDSDEDLAQRAAGGNVDAFDTLVFRYQDRIYNMLARMCGSPDEAEDLAQETFMKSYRALASFKQGSKFYTWLFRIAVNTGFSRQRKEVRRRIHEGVRLNGASDEDEGSVADVVPDPHHSDPAHEMDAKLVRERVREGLAQIDADYRSILILRDVEGMDYEAIAETLDISRAAVKSRLHRARLELARILKDLRPQ